MASLTAIRPMALRAATRIRATSALPTLIAAVLLPLTRQQLRPVSSGPSPVYKTKKVWPPDFSQLSAQEQLRFEKRFKRRVALRSERPRWVKFVKLAQLFSITFVVVYCVLFMENEALGPSPFQGFRSWLWSSLGVFQGGPHSAVQLKEVRPDGSTVPRAEAK